MKKKNRNYKIALNLLSEIYWAIVQNDTDKLPSLAEDIKSFFESLPDDERNEIND